MKYKCGMILQSKTSPVKIQLVSKFNGNGHWNSKKIGSHSKGKAHRIHEGTLDKFYEVCNGQ